MAIIDSLKDYFGAANVIAAAERSDLFCCYKKNSSGIVYQVIYIDCSDAWLQAGLEHYFEDILSQQYYTSEGYLQWNYYFYFIADDAIIRQHHDIKIAIENDEVFARKFVITEVELVERFRSVGNIGQAGGQLDGGDLYTEWLNYLRENELHFIYDDQNYPNYKSWVEQYAEGRPFLPPTDTTATTSGNAAPHISFLRRLDIDNFRLQPVLRTYEFGRVNLISGANATGKTSFFDTLEYCLTGKAKGADGEGYRLRLTTADDLIVPYPDAPAIYRQRDISWYKSVNTRGHNLPNNFNKFNYFSSDAAFVLKADDDRGENLIERTITDIAVGREINRLEERVSEFRSRFDTQHDTLLKASGQLIAELENLTRNAEEVQAGSTDSTAYRSAVTRYLAEHNWHIEENEDEDFIAAIATGVELVNNAYQDLVGNLPSSGTETPAEIDSAIERLTAKTNALAQFREEVNAAQRIYDQLQDSIGKLTIVAESADGLSLYFADPDFPLLPVIDEELKSADAKVALLQKAGECLTGLATFLQSQPAGTSNRKLMDYGQLQFDRRQQAQSDRQSAEALAEAIRDSVDQLTRLISDIKRLGSEYLEMAPGADHCPLCDTALLHEALADRVSSTAARFGDPEQYRLRQDEVRRHDRTIADTDRVLQEIDKFETMIPHQYLSAMADQTLDELQRFWERELALLPEAREELSRLKGIRERFEASGFTRQHLQKVQDDLNSLLNIQVEQEADLENALVVIQAQLEVQEGRFRTQTELISEIKARMAEIFEPVNPDDITLASNLRKWRAAKASLTNIQSVTALANNSAISEVHTNVLGLTSVFTIYKDHWYAQKMRTDALELITRSRQSVEERRRSNQAMAERVSSIIGKLDHLLTERSKMQYLADFVAANKQEIVGIFRQIHSPVEFEDINFDDNKVKLKDRVGDWHTINQVSTGQRTAVALSLFLSLNKKLSGGPDIIMMDDPVTYVDDLNTLSFFDYLRELVEQSGRQVFFATANTDVAFLFAKKFAYLGPGDFKCFEFKRSD